MLKPLPLHYFRQKDVLRVHYAPGEAQDFKAGMELLRQIAPSIPVYLFRIEQGVPVRNVRKDSTRLQVSEVTPDHLVAGVTAFGVPLEEDGQAKFVVVSPTPLQKPTEKRDPFAFGKPHPYGKPPGKRKKREP